MCFLFEFMVKEMVFFGYWIKVDWVYFVGFVVVVDEDFCVVVEVFVECVFILLLCVVEILKFMIYVV